jgi:hypothetical protein
MLACSGGIVVVVVVVIDVGLEFALPTAFSWSHLKHHHYFGKLFQALVLKV